MIVSGCYCQSMTYGYVWLFLSVYDLRLCLVVTVSLLSVVISGYYCQSMICVCIWLLLPVYDLRLCLVVTVSL